MRRLLFLFICLALWADKPAHAQSVTVFAAASLQDVLSAVAARFTERSKTPVRFSFAASSTLARQIAQGAPADLFASADGDWMDYLQKENAIDPSTRVNLLSNGLVLIAPKDGPDAVPLDPEALKAALAGGRLATGTVESVPVGRYAKAALVKLHLWSAVEPALVRTENVRAALGLVARGEAALGIVYTTDAMTESRVKIVATFPPASHPAIVYPFALMRNAGKEASTFLQFLQSSEAEATFQRFGFTRPAS